MTIEYIVRYYLSACNTKLKTNLYLLNGRWKSSRLIIKIKLHHILSFFYYYFINFII